MSHPPNILFFCMPYASSIPAMHSEKLITAIAPSSNKVFVLGDKRINLINLPDNVIRIKNLKKLHRRNEIKPFLLSGLLWLWIFTGNLIKVLYTIWQMREDLDIILCFIGVYHTPVLLLGKILGKKNIYFQPGKRSFSHNDQSPFRKYWHWFLSTLTDLNESLADICLKESYNEINPSRTHFIKKKVRIVKFFIDSDEFYEIIPLNQRTNIVGFIGRLNLSKGISNFINAAKKYPDKNVSFIIIGDGELREKIISDLSTIKSKQIQYISWIAHEEIPEHLNKLRLLVLPSSREGVSNIILEAMACGTPVLAAPVGGTADIIQHKKTGFILPDNSPETITSAIQNALSDPDSNEIADNAKSFIENQYTLSASIKSWRTIIQELTK